MAKIKLPRKRKKAFIKSNGKVEYMMAQILGELLQEEGQKHSERFYKYRHARTREEYRRSHNGMLKVNRW